MDSARFGRVLGVGARVAAKTLVEAVDAAAAPNPSAPRAGSQGVPESRAAVVGQRLGEQTVRAGAQIQQTGAGIKRGGKRFGEAVWGPFVKLSGVLWLEITGVFFGIFALFAGSEAWKMRSDIHETATNHDAHVHLLAAMAMAAIFGYFCLSGFVKANRRGRRG